MRWPQTTRDSLVWFHISGLITLPNYYQESWKTTLHRVYSALVLGFFNIYVASLSMTLLFHCSRDFSEFCQKFFEWMTGLNMAFAGVYVKYNLIHMIALLDAMDEVGYYHRRNKIIVKWRLRTRRVTSLGWKILACLMLVLSFLPLLPIPPSEQDRLRRIYGLKHPENTLAFPIYVPFVDPSDPVPYVILYAAMLYIGFLTVSLIFMSTFPYPIIVGDIKYYTQVVCEFFELLGRQQQNALGQPIFFTNVARNEYILQDVNRGSNLLFTSDGVFHRADVPALRSVFLRSPEVYERFYVSQVIQFQKKINGIRQTLDAMFGKIFNFCSLTCLAGLLMSTYCITLSFSSTIRRVKVILESTCTVVTYTFLFTCGEVLAACNNAFNRALYFSLWYKTSSRTRRAVVMVLRVTQRMKYVTIFNVYEMGFKLMVSTFRLAYSFFGLMNLQRSYLQNRQEH